MIGAGIGGLSAAIALRRVGLEVTVHERAPELREVGAGLMLWANALRALDALGAGDAVRAATMPVARVTLAAREGHRVQRRIETAPFERALGYAPFVGFVHRAELVAALAGLLPAGSLRFGHELVGVEERGERVAVRFANGHTDEADLLVGADGLRSAVRAALICDAPPRYAGYTCWRGVAPRPAALAPGELHLWTGRGAQVGLNAMTEDRVYWFATRNAPAGGRAPDERAAALDAFRGWAAPLPELIAATPADRVLRGDILDRPPARPWTRGRVVLVGDAAHPTTPNFGQGGGMAIEDAVVLARRLATAPDVAAALAGSEAERFARAAAVTNEAWAFGRMLQWEHPAAVAVRDALAGLALRVNGTRQLVKHARYHVGALPARRIA